MGVRGPITHESLSESLSESRAVRLEALRRVRSRLGRACSSHGPTRTGLSQPWADSDGPVAAMGRTRPPHPCEAQAVSAPPPRVGKRQDGPIRVAALSAAEPLSESSIRVVAALPLCPCASESVPAFRRRRRGRAGRRAAAGPLDHGMVRSAHHGSAPAAADGARGGRGWRGPLRAAGGDGCGAVMMPDPCGIRHPSNGVSESPYPSHAVSESHRIRVAVSESCRI